jgi:uncharacterized protein UPF0182
VKPVVRRRALLVGVGLLVAVLVGGRWLALETAERAWGASLPGGAAYLMARDFARLVSGLLVVGAVAWATANLLFVYRSIGSMQLSRRLGDLEIVEAVPQPLLLAGTIASGLAFGVLLTLGTGDWWMAAALASRAPVFGVTDPVLQQDLGYYLGRLPWSERLRELALLAVCSATVVVALLYVGIGSLRFRRWLPYANAHARAHLGVLLALLALTLTWGALLDPAEAVAGLHGTLTRRTLDARLTAAPVVTAFGVATTVASLVWGLREKPVLLVTAWSALLGASLLGFAVVPGSLSTSGLRAGPDTALAAERRRLEALAFGVPTITERAPPGFPRPETAATAVPMWDARRVLAAATARRDLVGPRATPTAAALSPHALGDGSATWLVALRPNLDSLGLRQSPPDWGAIHRGAWARVGRLIAAVEDDTVLAFAPITTRDSTSWFGPGFSEFAVATPDTWPALRHSGIALTGWWRRTALAWALQSPSLARAETDGLVLLWRRDVAERLERLAPFASFDDAAPVVADSALWWLAYGYFAAQAFPLVRLVDAGGRDSVRYLRAGLVGAVNAASGDTRLYLAPGADSLATAWARLLAPLIRPLDSLPAGLRARLPFPGRAFRAATRLVDRWRSDTTAWSPRPREPFEIVAPTGEGATDGAGARVWMAQGFEAGSTLAALVAATMTPDGPRLSVWQPGAARLPPVLVGSPNTTAPGVPRLWNVDGSLFSAQALFTQPATGGPPTGIDTVFLSWGERGGQGRSVAAALRSLLASAGDARGPADTALAARWRRAQQLAARADAALAAGDLETFGVLYRQLTELLGLRRRQLAPTPERR